MSALLKEKPEMAKKKTSIKAKSKISTLELLRSLANLSQQQVKKDLKSGKWFSFVESNSK